MGRQQLEPSDKKPLGAAKDAQGCLVSGQPPAKWAFGYGLVRHLGGNLQRRPYRWHRVPCNTHFLMDFGFVSGSLD